MGKNHTAIVLCDDATAEHGNRDGGTQDLSIHCTDHESLQSPPLKSLPTVTIYSTVCLCERDARCLPAKGTYVRAVGMGHKKRARVCITHKANQTSNLLRNVLNSVFRTSSQREQVEFCFSS